MAVSTLVLSFQATRQYARRQDAWLRRRFLAADRPGAPPVYAVSSEDPRAWDETCWKPAAEAVRAALAGRPIPLDAEPPIGNRDEDRDVARRRLHRCHICDLVLQGREQYEAHLRGRRHKKAAAALAKR